MLTQLMPSFADELVKIAAPAWLNQQLINSKSPLRSAVRGAKLDYKVDKNKNKLEESKKTLRAAQLKRRGH